MLRFSHELRTPISVMHMGLGLLDVNIAALPSDESAAASGLVKEVWASSRRCLNVLDDLMTFEELGSASIRLTLVQRPIVPFLRDIAAQFTLQAAVSGVAFRVLQHVDARVAELGVAMDATRLGHALGNLVYTAITHSVCGGLVTLAIAPVLAGDSTDAGDPPVGVRISLEDTAGSISFEGQTSFLSEVKFGSSAEMGNGVGLFIARNVVELHGGRLELASHAARSGCTFSVYLPLAPPADKVAPPRTVPLRSDSSPSFMLSIMSAISATRRSLAFSSSIAPELHVNAAAAANPLDEDASDNINYIGRRDEGSASSECAGERAGRALQLLVVDDSAMNRKMMVRMLAGAGHGCLEADNGATAVAMYTDRINEGLSFDVILMECVPSQPASRVLYCASC